MASLQSISTVAVAICALATALTLPACSPSSEDPPALVIAAGQTTPVVETTPAPLIPGPPGTVGNCCSCAVAAAQPLADNEALPCSFDHPVGWESIVGDDGALVSAVVGHPTCGSVCPHGAPGIAFSIGTSPDANAAVREDIWRQVMPIAGDARCHDSTVTFFSPPGADPNGLLGGVKFYVGFNGKKYSGGATFTCGLPGEWVNLRDLFISSFRTNPGTTFPRGSAGIDR